MVPAHHVTTLRLILRKITQRRCEVGTADQRREFVEWITRAIAPRNITGLAEPARRNLYPVDFDALMERHALMGMSRDELIEALPALRGTAPPPAFVGRPGLVAGDLAPTTSQSPFYTRERGNHA